MFETFDAETAWLTITNVGLGLVTLICIVAVGYIAFKEYFSHVHEEVRSPLLQDDHSFSFGNLGITMADGGERIDEKKILAGKESEEDLPNIIRGEN